MARGATLLQLISDLRDELRRANSPSAGPDDTGPLRRTINHVYRTIYAALDWPHLKTYYPKMTMNAGQLHYDVPTGLDYTRILDVRVWWNGVPQPIERGIDFSDYASYDSTTGVRSSPVIKWDLRFTGNREQIEFWPLPDSSEQSVQFVGMWAFEPLVDDTDICRLDSEIIVLYAAAELLPDNSPDKKAKLQLVQEMLRLEKVRASSGAGKTFQLGLGDSSSRRASEAVVRVR